MTVYFYHTQDLNYIYREWKAGKFPGHLLYGATHLPDEGIEVVMHRHSANNGNRIISAIKNTVKILFCKEKFDAVYATKYNGIELLIFLRAIGLYRKPVILWHHQPVIVSEGWVKNRLSRLFYKGIDHMFFFSDHILEASLATGKVSRDKVQQCPWGADLDFYDRLTAGNTVMRKDFISTGKERRDMPTLLAAFGKCRDQHLDLITAADCCGTNYEEMLSVTSIPENVSVTINRTMWIPELAERILPHKCICICCKETNYTVGLTTLVEALAFGMPVIISKNPNQPFDAGKEGCGITVDYNDAEGWSNAIRYIADHPEAASVMGKRARELAGSTYNIARCAHVVAETLRKFEPKRN
ncbi:MAG: glycosyltransferase [Bacteroidales bacterium]|nr:glycosyltransferase [Bacteroidales bacterium]MCM1148367.1 glycosyltransferase [Bacteroidales bacterium]MCM1207040.1 glycosyltransferase [Bacillota bacterium]MCM1511311.1 glycosyltransferase [Clostridium sp.]